MHILEAGRRRWNRRPLPMVRSGEEMGVPLATRVYARLTDRTRARGIRVAGTASIILAAGAALLPAGKRISSDMIGGLLVSAGLLEAVAGSLRREVRPFAMAAGGVTAIAGLLFLLNPETHFFPTVTPVIGWLLLRSLILLGALTESGGSVRRWTALSAGMGFVLAVRPVSVLPISTIGVLVL